MAISAVAAAAGLAFLGGLPRIVFVIVALDAFVASFAAGVGGTGWLIQGEVFPTDVRGQAAAIAAMVDWVANFALIEVFPQWESGVGLAWVLVSFAALCVVAVIFVRTWLPETKGHSVDEIIRLFERHAQAGTGTGPGA
jgi:MFS transporter, SP family, arabinose:H+ symporter